MNKSAAYLLTLYIWNKCGIQCMYFICGYAILFYTCPIILGKKHSSKEDMIEQWCVNESATKV